MILHCRKKCNTLKDCDHWNQGIICVVVLVLVIYLSSSSAMLALRRPVFEFSVLTLQVLTVVLWEVNSACNIHRRVQQCPSDEYVFLFNNFGYLHGLAL